MALQDILQRSFSITVKARGRVFFTDKKVQAGKSSDHSASFVVEGQGNFLTAIDWSRVESERTIQFYCSCSHFAEGNNCKHLWASVLHGDRHRSWPSQFPRRLFIKRIKNLAELETDMSPIRGSELTVPVGAAATDWVQVFESVNRKLDLNYATRKVFYGLEISRNQLFVKLTYKEFVEDQAHTPFKKISSLDRIESLDQSEDQEILYLLHPDREENSAFLDRVALPKQIAIVILQKMSASGRLHTSVNQGGVHSSFTPLPLLQQDFEFHGEALLANKKIQLTGKFADPLSAERFEMSEILWWDFRGLFISTRGIGRFSATDSKITQIIHDLSQLWIDVDESDLLIQKIYSLPNLKNFKWPQELRWPHKTEAPGKVIHLLPSDDKKAPSYAPKYNYLQVLFEYQSQPISEFSERQYFVAPAKKTIFERNLEEETIALDELFAAGAVRESSKKHANLKILESKFLDHCTRLIENGWSIKAQNKKVTVPGAVNVSVKSGVDWFEVDAKIKYQGNFEIPIPELLSKIQSGERFIELENGEMGIIPQSIISKYKPMVELGDLFDNKVSFKRSQGLLLDGLLDGVDELSADDNFTQFRQKISSYKLQQKSEPNKKFSGVLRGYQKTGLAWLEYLESFSLGGILADDMGLGKTIQVLAYLQKKKGEKHLIVVPKTLLDNWQIEAGKFTPNVKTLVYSGTERIQNRSELEKYNCVIVTYHTLRNDLSIFRDIEFSTVILDEAQNIKNPKSQIHRACLKLRAEQFLALTGTPIENSIADLFAIMDVCTPGLLSTSVKKRLINRTQDMDSEDLESLNKALAPLILRRTKKQVLEELPDKTVATISCELSEEESKRYDELKNYYQSQLSDQFTSQGFNNSKIQILEALLRLRQAACHPGLIDQEMNDPSIPSSKITTLVEQIKELREGGHKCLVFSQFTSFLKIIAGVFDKDEISYLYLDGQTKKRQALVDRFQDDDSISTFLISLKAGGSGLNLTAADYVFILDPWWNPASEEQAIDRAHRIGQTKKVFAYKFIAKDTVEEKILKLQERKKGISESVIQDNQSVLSQMTQDDFNFLLN